jgi:hypothetical protein
MLHEVHLHLGLPNDLFGFSDQHFFITHHPCFVLRIFGPKREGGGVGGWRRLHKEELCNLCVSSSIIRVIKSGRIRWVRNVARMAEMRNAYTILVVIPEGKRPLGEPRRRWEDNTGMDLREIRWEGVDWLHLAQDTDQCRALVNTVMDLGFYKRRGISRLDK